MSADEIPQPRLPLALALAPLGALFAAIVGGAVTLGFRGELLFAAMLFAACIAGAIAAARGKGWREIQHETGQRIADALPAILILLSIGALLGSWMFSGTIPLMITLGIDLINPRFMVLTAFVATALMSTITGTSWGSAGTIGVALMGTAHAMGLPLAPVAGAVVSGAYFGDKLSPLSDMTNIAAIGARVDLFVHIRHMLDTSLPPTLIALAVYVFVGMSAGASNENLANALLVKSELDAIFDLGIAAAAPLVIAIVGIALRQPPALVIVASSAFALIIGVAVQGFPPAAALATFVNGFDLGAVYTADTSSAGLTSLLNRGGVFSMAPTLMFIIAAFLLAGAMQVSGALDSLLHALLSMVRSAFGLVAAAMAAGAVMVAMTSHGGVTSLVVGGLFHQPFVDRGLAPENLSRAIEDSVVVTEPLMPWTVSALFMATTLGVATAAYLPWAVFCLLGPLTSLVFAAMYQLTGVGLRKAKAAPDEAIDRQAAPPA
ncbi:MAG: Na+/H+ antiporter NhaC family protein [Hyphomonadaceae bacterium]